MRFKVKNLVTAFSDQLPEFVISLFFPMSLHLELLIEFITAINIKDNLFIFKFNQYITVLIKYFVIYAKIPQTLPKKAMQLKIIN